MNNAQDHEKTECRVSQVQQPHQVSQTVTGGTAALDPPDKAPSGGPIIEVRALNKTFRMGDSELPVLRGIDLSVTAGEWLGLFGRSGSGKSTLLHLIGGLDTSDSGQILYRGAGRQNQESEQTQNVAQLRGRKLDRYRATQVGFVFQAYHLLPELTALENVAIAGRIGGRGDHKQRAEYLLERVGLKDRTKHRPAKLSGGERQRVAIARALINDPGVLLADEPTGNLDAETGASILDLLHQLHDDGQTILMVTHDESIVDHADRVVRLTRGLIDTDG